MNKAIFWDFDGTLVYCHSLWSNSVLQVLNEQLPNRGITLADAAPMASGYPLGSPEPHSEIKADAWWPLCTANLPRCTPFWMELAAAESLGPYTRELILDVSNTISTKTPLTHWSTPTRWGIRTSSFPTIARNCGRPCARLGWRVFFRLCHLRRNRAG